MKIILLGYMGSGKSTIGKSLSQVMYYPFIDLDEYIVKQEGSSISKIFEKKGEVYFRKIEHIYLKEILEKEESLVLSLGGGTPCYAKNMDIINAKEDVTSFYLQLNIPTLSQRLEKQKSTRPLVADLSEEKLTEYIAKHLFERREFYIKATHTINADNRSIQEITQEIRDALY